MLHIFYGRDDFSQREALNALKQRLDADGLLASNTTLVDGRTVTPGELLALCQTVPFLSAHRLIIVEGLLGRFEPPAGRGRRGRRQGTRENLAPWRALADGLAAMPESTSLVLRDGEVQPQNPLFRLLQPLAEVREFRPLAPRDVPGWIVQRARQSGLTIAPRAVALLASLVGNDLWTLSNELDKLAAYADGRQVEEEDVRALVSSIREANVFAMADALTEGRTEDAAGLIRRLLEEGDPPQRLLAVIARHYRHLIVAKDLLAGGLPPPQIGARLGVPGFALERILQQTRRYSMPRLKTAMGRILEADLSIKRGLCDEETALHLLVQDLGGLARAAPRGASRPGGRRG
jgi:DNA polymerase-3 subunit delta